ncbi:MAG TPA: hypothetical protein VF491_08700 [Vicinamibacterales bacterium]
MHPIRAGLRPAFGLFVVAHGLAHAVLSPREWMEPSRLATDFMPLILYGVAATGFTAAGLGVLGLNPLKWTVRPAMLLASAYSLIAISRFGQGGMWWSATADVALFVIGLSGLFLFAPVAPSATLAHPTPGAPRHHGSVAKAA